MTQSNPTSFRRAVPGRWHEPRNDASVCTESFGSGPVRSLELFRRVARRDADRRLTARLMQIFGA